MYNISETCSRKLKNKIANLINWQKTRHGFLQHLVNQKIGLFHHMSGHDVIKSSQLAIKYCTSLTNVSHIVRECVPVDDTVRKQ